MPISERIATFDQEGTLWVEHLVHAKLACSLGRVSALVKADPTPATVEFFMSVLPGDRAAIAALPMDAPLKIVSATLTGMTVDELNARVNDPGVRLRPGRRTPLHPRRRLHPGAVRRGRQERLDRGQH